MQSFVQSMCQRLGLLWVQLASEAVLLAPTRQACSWPLLFPVFCCVLGTSCCLALNP
jgi:hypothetical protein